jgi:unsaturated chondroitin disaccharide hydrolase
MLRSSASYHDDGAGRHNNITYGDYFFIEALAKLNGTDPMLWI